MKKTKKLAALTGVLVIVSAAALCISGYQEKKEAIRTSGETILAVPVSSVQSVQWQEGSEKLGFHKDGSWLYDEDESFPVDGGQVEAVLASFEQLQAAFVIEDPEDTSVYGMSSPAATIQLTASDGSYTITLGDYSTLDARRYVDIGDGNVYLVEKDPLESLSTARDDFMKNDTLPTVGEVQRIEFTGEQTGTVTRLADGASLCAEDVYFMEQGGEMLPLDTKNVDSWVSAVKNLTLTDYAFYSASEEELAACGLDEPVLTAAITWTTDSDTEETLTIHVGQNREELAASAEDAEAAVTRYVRIGNSRIIYVISQYKFSTLTAVGYQDLRHSDIMPAAFDDLTSLTFTLEDTVYTITAEKGEEDAVVFSYEGTGLEEQALADLRTAVRSMSAVSYTDEEPSGVLEISALYTVGDELLQIDLYRLSGSECLAVVNGEPLCLVSRSAVVDLREAVYRIVLG